ncbi:MAG: glycosyl transferase family 1, partial [Kaistella sp.]
MKSKKILIITYYWAPAGGPGVQRWLKFVKYLPDFGWKPAVFIPENPSYPIVDETLQNEVSKHLEIIKTKIWEPYQIAEFFGKDNKKFKAGQFDVGKNQNWKSKISIWV